MVGLAVAVVLGVVFGPETGLPWPVFLVLSSAAAAAALRWPFFGTRLGVWLSAASVGAGWSTLALAGQVPCPEGPVVVDGEVAESRPGRLEVLASTIDGVPVRQRLSLRALDEARPLPEAFSRVRVRARLFPLDGSASNPGERDLTLRFARRAQGCRGRFEPAELVVAERAPAWRRWLEVQRRGLEAWALTRAPSREAGQLFAALAVGTRESLGDALETAFNRSGLAHVLSVSGLHVAAFAVVLLFGLRRLFAWAAPRRWRWLEPRALAVPIALPLVWGYVLLTGAEPPAVRSAVMVSALLVGVLTRRRADVVQGLAVAAAVLVVWEPAAFTDLSVQLSFVSVVGLVGLAPALRRAVPVEPPTALEKGWRRRWARLREALLQAACASLGATLATAPLLAQVFHRVGWVGVVSNVVCAPLSAALSVVAAFSALAWVTHAPLVTVLVWLGGWLSRALLAAAAWFATWPGAGLEVPAPGLGLTLAWWAGLIALARAERRGRWLGLLAPAALGLAVWLDAPHAGLEVTFLSVGHGDAVVLSSRGRHALVDGGGVPNGGDVGRRVVLPFLRQRGIRRLELAALSHAHPDHALGLASALREVPVATVWLPNGSGDGPLIRGVREAAATAQVLQVEAGARAFGLGEARVEVLGPPVDRELLEGENDRSLVLRVVHGEVSFLLTGDVETAGEHALVAPPSTVVKAPHHGSRTSSTPGLVGQTRPRHVVFCVGRKNRFGFPHPEVVERWLAAGAECHRTDLHGAVTFRSDGSGVVVSHFKEADDR